MEIKKWFFDAIDVRKRWIYVDLAKETNGFEKSRQQVEFNRFQLLRQRHDWQNRNYQQQRHQRIIVEIITIVIVVSVIESKAKFETRHKFLKALQKTKTELGIQLNATKGKPVLKNGINSLIDNQGNFLKSGRQSRAGWLLHATNSQSSAKN